MGRTGWDHARFARIPAGKKQQGAALHPLGRISSFLIGRNGHDGSANASPDPLLLAPDPMSWHIAYQTGHNLGSYKNSSLSVRLDSGRRWIISVSYPPKDFRVLT